MIFTRTLRFSLRKRPFLFLALLVVTLTSFGVAFSGSLVVLDAVEVEGDLSSHLADGKEAVRLGEYEEALESLGKVLAAEPANREARLVYVQALVDTGENEKALEVLKSHPDFEKTPEVLATLSEVLLRIGRVSDGLKTVEKAIALAPGSPRVLYLHGESLRQGGELVKAKEVFDRSIDSYRDLSHEDAETSSPRDFVYWALALKRLNRYKDANDVMFPQAEDRVKELAKEEDETDAFLLVEWGKLFYDKYNFPDSRFYYRKAIDQNPYHADALAALADNLITDFQEGTRRYDMAERYLKRALRVDPRHAESHRVMARIWFQDGYLDKAIGELQKSLETNPANLSSLGLLASCYYVAGNEAAFKDTEKRALTVNAKGAEFYHTIALAIEKKFRYPDIVRFSDLALQVDPDYWPAFSSLGINCLRMGDGVRGREFLDKAWEKDRFNVWVDNTRKLLRHMDRQHISFENDRFVYFLPRAVAPIMRPYLEPLLDRAYESLARRYKLDIEGPIRIESFSQHKWFSARTIGLEGLPASGACFGKVVTLTTPEALPQNWGAVAWHEFAHVVTLQMTEYRVPRWLTEGVSVYEEGLENPLWRRNFQRDIADAWASGWILPIAELDFGFSKPKFPTQILLSYYQGCLVVDYISGKWGFDKVLGILDGYRNHKSISDIFEEVLGEDLTTFDRGFFAFVDAWVKRNGYTPSPAGDILPGLELRRENDPENVELLIDLAWAYLVSDHGVDAMSLIGKALELNPESGDGHAVLGMVRYSEKQMGQAREELEKALGLGTRFRFRAHRILGELYADEKDFTKAIEHFEEAKKTSPVAGASHPQNGGNVYYHLAKLFEQSGDPDKAIAQMEELAPLAPENGECRFRVAKYAMEKRDYARAARMLEDLMFINPLNSELHTMRWRAAEALEDWDVVIREVEILLLDPSTNPILAHLALARAHHAKKDPVRARKSVQRVLEIDPEDEDARSILEELGSE